MSSYSSSGKGFNKTLYGFNNVPVTASGSTGSGNIDVSQYYTKSTYGYIGGSTLSGSITISGSFDSINWFKLTGSQIFNSGTLNYITITDAVPLLKVSIFSAYTGSASSGSLFLVAA